MLEGVPLPDAEVVCRRARGRVLAGAGPGGGLVGALCGEYVCRWYRVSVHVRAGNTTLYCPSSMTIPQRMDYARTLFISPRRWRSARYWQRRHSGWTVPMSISARNWSEGLWLV